MSYFVAGLTNVDPEVTAPVYKSYHYVQYNYYFPTSATASVIFPPTADDYRYVIIQQRFGSANAICLIEVRVYLTG